MRLKIILITLLLISNVFASDFDINNLTPQEIKTLKEIKAHGKENGLSYSLMAIAIKESGLGKYLVNVDTKDYGLYQANIKTVIKPSPKTGKPIKVGKTRLKKEATESIKIGRAHV